MTVLNPSLLDIHADGADPLEVLLACATWWEAEGRQVWLKKLI